MWEPLIKKFEAKLSKWNQKFLSMAGKVTLINSVVTALPIYLLSFYKSTAVLLVLLCLLWGGGPDQNKIAWIRWETVTSSKENGGLDIKDITNFNIALLGKWRWDLMQNKRELWTRVVQSKYGGWQGMLAADRAGLESVWWRDLKKALIHSQQGQIINSGIRWKVGLQLYQCGF